MSIDAREKSTHDGAPFECYSVVLWTLELVPDLGRHGASGEWPYLSA